jgi:protein phosphatase
MAFRDMKEGTMQIEHVAKTNVGLVRSMNQDAIMDMPEHGVFLVADGMGGEKAGEEASAQVVETLRGRMAEFFKNPPAGASQIEGEMRDGLLQANRDVFRISVREPEKKGLGSTASLLVLHRGIYFCAQVGDSRIYLMHDGKIHQVTRDHTLVWALYEQGAITRDQLETHPDRHLLTQCIGNERPIKVDTYMDQAHEGDLFLICSDGLTGYAGEPKVFEILRDETLDLPTRAELLIQAALDAGGGDNVSVILARVAALDETDDWEPEETAPPARFTDQDTSGAFATSMRPPLDELEGVPAGAAKKSNAGLWIFLLLLLLGGAGGAAYFLRGPAQVPVYLRANDRTPGRMVAHVAQGGTALKEEMLQGMARGFRFTVPGPGIYDVEFTAEGYLPVSQTVELIEGAAELELPPFQWVRKPTLMLRLPEGRPVDSVRVVATGGPQANDIALVGDALTAEGGELTVYVESGVSYVVEARGGGQSYASQPQELRAGDVRTINIYFPEATPTPRPVIEAVPEPVLSDAPTTLPAVADAPTTLPAVADAPTTPPTATLEESSTQP